MGGLVGGVEAGVQPVPCVVGDVVGAAGLVDAEHVGGAVLVGQLDADVVAVDGHGPVGDAVGVDEAAENTDGGGVLLVGGDAGGARGGEGGAGKGERGSSVSEHLDKDRESFFVYKE